MPSRHNWQNHDLCPCLRRNKFRGFAFPELLDDNEFYPFILHHGYQSVDVGGGWRDSRFLLKLTHHVEIKPLRKIGKGLVVRNYLCPAKRFHRLLPLGQLPVKPLCEILYVFLCNNRYLPYLFDTTAHRVARQISSRWPDPACSGDFHTGGCLPWRGWFLWQRFPGGGYPLTQPRIRDFPAVFCYFLRFEPGAPTIPFPTVTPIDKHIRLIEFHNKTRLCVHKVRVFRGLCNAGHIHLIFPNFLSNSAQIGRCGDNI